VATFDAVLFDFDGVLVDSEPLHFACWRDVAARRNLTIDWDWYRREAIGVSDRDMVAMVCRLNHRTDELDALWALFDEKKRLFSERIVANVPMPASVKAMLANLTLPAAVVSTSFRNEVEPALTAAGVRSFFQTIVCGEDVANLKPHPEPYLEAAKRLAAQRPLVVEDSETGAQAGRAAGFTVVRVANPADTPAALARAVRGAG
jgi:HAD superfamily hydrolase (TIGR01509 family)